MAYKIVFEYMGGHGDVGLFWRSDAPSPLKGAAHLPFSMERLLTTFHSNGDNTAQVVRDHHRFDVRSSSFKTRFQIAVSQAPEGSQYDFALLIRNMMGENSEDAEDRVQLDYNGADGEALERASIGAGENHEEVGTHGHSFTVKHNGNSVVKVTVFGPRENHEEL